MAGRHRSAAPSAGPPLLPIIAAAAVVVVILLAGVVVRLVGGDGNGDADAAPPDTASAAGSPTPAASPSGSSPSPSPTVTASASPSPTATASASPSPTAQPSKKPRDAPTLTLEVTRSISYIEVRGPNGQVYVLDTLAAGFKRSWDDPRLTVVLGNSAAVKVTVNGTVRPRGGEGEVENFTVTAD